MKHQYLQPSTSQQYWDFSFHEIAKYDLPAVIDYVLAKTNRTFAHYVGHSQGTTVVLAMLSLFPRYNRKLKTLHLMAPAVYLRNTSTFIKAAVTFYEPLEVKDLSLLSMRLEKSIDILGCNCCCRNL